MRIGKRLGRDRPTISFEFMAPRDDSEVEVLERTIAALAPHAPDFVSVTYRVRNGDKTLELVTRIKRQFAIEAMAHLTCANTPDQTRRILNWMEREGVANVLALRGDPPEAGEPFVAPDASLAHASDLVAFIRKAGYRFGLGAACGAERHLESPDWDHEMRYLKLKVEAGCDFLITQMFFDNRFYFELIERVAAAGIDVPVLPGLMPITNARSLARMVESQFARTTVPKDLVERMASQHDDEGIRRLGVEHTIAQCAELLEAGVPGLHFYTFNRAKAPIEILQTLRGQQLLAS